MPKLKLNDLVLGFRRSTQRLILGIEVQPDGKVYYNYYKGNLTGVNMPAEAISTRTMGRCNENTMLNWGAKQ